ncbi:MAG: hypothetical protein A2Y15_00490 [Clostridiales bacterium GWF2_36_10]|nr:MAG: hypothetical protein A2Y15_00490 [Clostridiales bacterium GWF2_36_10]HAN21731.1 hypothetical protein [Clostridiales bacterium]
MNKSAIIKIIIASVVVLILTAVLIVSLVGERSNLLKNIFHGISNSDSYKSGNINVSTESITGLDVNWISGSVKITTHNGSEISVSETSSDILDDEDKLCYLVENGVLYIKYWKPRGVFSFGRMFSPTKYLTVSIPESKADLLDTLKVDAVSADTNIDKISIDDMDLKSVSGNIYITPVGSANSIKANTVSGEININAIVDSADFKSVSGDIVFNNIVKKIACKSVSGDIDIKSENCPDEIYAKSVSGEITFTIPENKGFTAKYSKVSGNFNCSFATVNSKEKAVYGDGSASFEFSTVSGDISIKNIKIKYY